MHALRLKIDIGAPSGGALAALEFGPADRPVDLIFLHANGFNALAYRTLLSPLASHLRMLAYDQRGHGRTTLRADPNGRQGWDDLAADLEAVIEAIDGPPVTLVGHSMGGTASLLAAARKLERVNRIVLLDPVLPAPPAESPSEAPHSPSTGHVTGQALAEGALRRRRTFPSREAVLEAYRGRGAFRTWSEEALVDYIADGFRDRPDGTVELACSPDWEASNFLAQGHDAWGALRRLSCPIRILRAEYGSTCDLTHSLSNVTVENLPGTTHFLPFEKPDRIRDVIVRND